MRTNTLKQKLAAGQPVFGSMITFPAPPVVEMLGFLGYDWVLIDNEHGSITVDLAEEMIRAAEYAGAAPIVRPVGNRPDIIAPFLDRGAWGVQVPHVNTADEARAAVAAVKYYPEGERGLFSGGRPAEYGFSGATPDLPLSARNWTPRLERRASLGASASARLASRARFFFAIALLGERARTD